MLSVAVDVVDVVEDAPVTIAEVEPLDEVDTSAEVVPPELVVVAITEVVDDP